ncbi:MAG: YggT family protein [Candidatus Omnitrophota bacterium]
MFILANLIYAVASILNLAITIVIVLIFLRAVISWVNADPYNSIVQFLYRITEPLLEPIRKIIPVGLRMSIDVSPIIAFVLLTFIRLFIVATLFDLSMKLKGW